MRVFAHEDELRTTLDQHDELVYRCIAGSLSFARFLELYDTFYCFYALDGHESDAAEQELLGRFEGRIALHRDVWEEVLTRVCSDEDAMKPEYIGAGRFGSTDAVPRLRTIVERHSSGTASE